MEYFAGYSVLLMRSCCFSANFCKLLVLRLLCCTPEVSLLRDFFDSKNEPGI